MKTFAFHRTIQAIILTIYVVLFVYLLASGQSLLYLNPTYNFLIVISIIGLSVMIFSLSVNTSSIVLDTETYVLFLLPILFVLLLGFSTVESTFFELGDSLSSPASYDSVVANYSKEMINFSEGRYWYANYYDVSSYPKEYVGNPVHISGYVLQPDWLEDGYYILARRYVWHCLADSQEIGFLFESSNVTLVERDWYSIRGYFTIFEGETGYTPMIKSENIAQIDPPARPYVF